MSIIGGLASAAGSIMGGMSGDDAGEAAAEAAIEAAKIYTEDARKAREEFREAAQRGIEAIQSGTEDYRTTVGPMMGSPDYLRPAQEQAREDVLREGRNTLAASNLRGAGRAGVGQVIDADRRFTQDAYESNQDRQDQTRSNLARVQAQEGGSIANTEIGAGNRIGESLQQQGRIAANAAQQAGAYRAGGQMAQSQGISGALGSIGSVIANEWQPFKTADPPSS